MSGSILAAADAKKQDALKTYGYHVGIAFQMADDLLDYTATEKELGKNPGADMREGKLTLPLIYSLGNASEKDRKWMESVIIDPEFDAEKFSKLSELLFKYQGIEYTRKKAQDHADTAKKALKIFEACPSKTLLTLIADYSIERKV